jgi:hypothetical protein
VIDQNSSSTRKRRNERQWLIQHGMMPGFGQIDERAAKLENGPVAPLKWLSNASLGL